MAEGPPTLDVQHVARLAALELTDAEASRLQKELGTIVAYVAQLDELDTREVPPTAHVQLDRLPWREDALLPCLEREEVLSQAPAAEGDYFAVPTFVE